MYLTQPLHRNVQQQPDTIATVFGNRTHTYAETLSTVSALAGGLRGLGIAAGDRVAILAVNSDRYLQTILATAWAGAVIVPMNTRWNAQEMAYAVDDAGVEVLVVDDAFTRLAGSLARQCPTLATVVHCGEDTTPTTMAPYSALVAESVPIPDAHRCGDELAGIFYTGGTTGRAKGVMLSHRNLFASVFGGAVMRGCSVRGRALHVAPMFHLAGLTAMLSHLALGGTHVILPGFDPVATITAIAEHTITDVLLVPTMIQMTVDHPRIADLDMSSLKFLMYGASPISEALLQRARATFPTAKFVQAYGMTELSPTATMLLDADHEDPVRRRSAGQAVPHALIKIVDSQGTEVPRGEFGEIAVSGEHVMLGYWNNAEETAAAVRDGWMFTGDGGYMDDAGYVYISDRIKDMIVSGGENVYSIEVENVVAKHPAVLQCAVIGVPDDTWGERVHAVVKLEPGASLGLDELQEHSRRAIAGYKVPRSMQVVDAFPMSGAGKILKCELRRKVAAATAQ